MHKHIGFIRRRPDMTFDQFSTYWRSTHRVEAEKLRPWLKGYVQAHLSPGPIPDIARPADGCPMLWIDQAADLAAMVSSHEFRTGAHLDEPRFMEARASGLAVEEIVIATPTRGGVKLMLCASPRDGHVLPFDMGRGWLCSTAHAQGHVRNRALVPHTIDPQHGFAGVEEIWWPDRAAFDAHWADATPPGALPWCDPTRLKAAFVEELVVFTPPGNVGEVA